MGCFQIGIFHNYKTLSHYMILMDGCGSVNANFPSLSDSASRHRHFSPFALRHQPRLRPDIASVSEFLNTGVLVKHIILFMLMSAAAMYGHAQAVGNLAGISIIDRDSGTALSPYFYRGDYWVAGRPGTRYAIAIQNRLGARMLAVTSVDGVNVVSGATAAWDQTGYVFSPNDCYQISGWRKSDAEVAAFTFTSLPNSYAARTGRPANVGVIGVAIFRERPVQYDYDAPNGGRLSPLPQAPRQDESDAARANGAAAEAALAAKLGTGHGEREYSYVNRTEFIRIHYDSLENLMAMGIVRRPRPAMPGANPFPGSPDAGYVADPSGF
jgi:hypothetical protein